MKKRDFLKRWLLGLTIIFGAALILCACGKTADSASAAAAEYYEAPVFVSGSSRQLKIAVASDLHIDPTAGTKIMVDPLYAWNIEITQALLWDAQQEGVDLLVVTGDITNAARHEQHETLLKLLNEAKEKGLNILILNGNHDIGSTTTDEFAEYYGDFGYRYAYSRDESSLSYCIRLPEHYLIMLDTGGYSGPNLSGDVSPETCSWFEARLREAQELDISVLVFGHYPVLTAQAGEFIGLEELRQLFFDYDVPLYICGHMHGRHIAVQDGLTELVVEQAVTYPCSYAIVTQYSTGEISYEPKMIDVQNWALAVRNNESTFLAFNRYREMVFRDRCKKLVDNFRDSREVSEKQAALANEFYYQFQYSLSNGHLFRDYESLKKHSGYAAFMDLTKGSVYERWVAQSLEYVLPYSEGFVITDNTIRSTAEGYEG